ncbi:MAG: hypothetical protein JWQ71_1020, partial [Pedosphaera sp.]|nr:hypothetical protein [Pedosphaera sp.]
MPLRMRGFGEESNMKFVKIIGWSSALCLSATLLQAQETNEVELLKRQFKEATENFDKTVREQRQIIDSLSKRLDAVQQQLVDKTNEPSKAAAAVTGLPSDTQSSKIPATLEKSWSPTDPLKLVGGAQNYISLSFDALVAAGTSTASDIESLELGGHDPKQRGFTIQNLETVFEGKIDPYFRGQANIVLQIDPHGETIIEAEEAYLETLSLPLNLQVKAGQFFTEFGRLNPTHPHTWDFVDQPLVNGRFLGEDGLRSAGARISWLTPTPFYSELFFALQNSQGGTAFSFRNDHGGMPFLGRTSLDRRVKTLGDMLFVPRYVASFNLSDAQTLVAGASAAFGPNSSGNNTDTQIYGVDLFWKWKSPKQHAGFPFVTWQTEAMMRRFQAGAFNGDLNGNGILDPGEQDINGNGVPDLLPRETVVDYGAYSQVSFGFRKGWVAALRGDYVFPEKQALYERILGPDLERATRWRISPNLTWYPSEFSKIRLQYNFDHRNGIGDDHSVWMQFEFLL